MYFSLIKGYAALGIDLVFFMVGGTGLYSVFVLEIALVILGCFCYC